MRPETLSENLSRRTLLQGGLAGGFLLAFQVPVRAASGSKEPTHGFAPNAFIRIDKTGKISFIIPQCEMGQAVYTSLSMILAEELDADFAQISVEHAPANEKLYANPMAGIQATGNSNSIRAFWSPMRKAGASARAMLIEAAAQAWNVDKSTCTTAAGQVIHTASNRKAHYGKLAEAAAKIPPPHDPPLKDPKDFRLIGKPLKRLDVADKVNGKAVFGIDRMLPGMKFATVAASPVFGGKLRRVDDSKAKTIPGVRQVIALDDMVAVVGDHMWAAKQGLNALVIDWDDGANTHLSSSDIWAQLRTASKEPGITAKLVGNIVDGLAAGEKIEADFELPFLAHAPMEPLNCTVLVTKDSCDIWIGTQIMARVQSTAAQLLGMPVDKVTVHQHLLGGGFGRRLEPDMALKAVRVGRALQGVPVKVVYTREEDIRHDIYRPVYRDVISASLSGGKISAWDYRVAGSSIIARWLPPAFKNGVDFDAVASAVDMPYDIPNFRVAYVRDEPPAVPTGFWRGVGPNNNVFAIESFMDELAKKAGEDPIVFRRDMLGKSPRAKAVLDLVAEKSDWGKPLPARTGRGVCLQPSFGSFVATVIEAEVDQQGEVQLRRITSAVDTGIAINPDTIVAQLQGGLVFGLTAALYGDITIENGRVRQSNFHDYRMLRMAQIPPTDVHVVPSGETPGGIGEAGATAGPPALRNAIYAATGVALRRLPIDRNILALKKRA
jgi:isoquinoline 1-oxidoreductase beta subunit